MVETIENKQQKIEYVRQFSSLGDLQQVHEIRYQLKGAADCWQLSAEVKAGTQQNQCDPLCLNCSEQLAKQLLCFLYENAMPPEHWRDVAEDLLPDGTIQG